MRVLFLSFYYPPDIGPGPLRAQSLVDALVEFAGEDFHIDVLTTMPNRYHTHTVDALAEEQSGPVSIKRFRLPAHRSGMGDQARSYLAYAMAVVNETRGGQWDLILATSSRLMTATLGAWVAKRTKAHLYLDIRDLFTDTMDDVLAKSHLRRLMPVFRIIERWTFRSADKINVVSSGFLQHLKRVAPNQFPSVFTNGIDDEFLDTDFRPSRARDVPLVLYAGNMGDGQGLHHIIPSVAAELDGEVDFRFVGDGGRRSLLQDLIGEKSVCNVQILDPVSRQDLVSHYREADVLFLHLNDFNAFRRVLPSKIFEYAATGKPILAGVGGYAADFLREQVPGVEVFKPCDGAGMLSALKRALDSPKTIDRTEFCVRFRREAIMRMMAKEIIDLVASKTGSP